MRKPIIVGNWKMNKDIASAKEFITKFNELTKDSNIETEYAIAAPFTFITEMTNEGSMPIAAQNVSQFKSGAYTGEVSIDMLKDINVKYVVIGHSERREMFNETDTGVNEKLIAVLTDGTITPIVAFGETEEQYEAGNTKDVVKSQIEKALVNVSKDDFEKIVLAYEPIWAIGTGKTATADTAQDVISFVRQILSELSSDEISQKVRIQYGGSVKPENVKELMSKEDIDGALVGGASIEAEDFAKLVAFDK